VNRARSSESPIDEARLRAELEAIAAEHGAASPQARKAVSERMRKYWAERRKGKAAK